MKQHPSRKLRLCLLAATLFALGGCASTGTRHPGDPWEGFNRGVWDFNESVDAALLRPVATAYRQAIPPLVRTGVSNFFGNLSDVWSFVNSALQGKLQDAADNFARVQANTVWGVFGIFDVASEFGIERHKEDFGQTLGRWGVPAGPYLMLPLLGPYTLRDAAALPIDRKADFVRYIGPDSTRFAADALRVVNQRSNLLRVGAMLDEAALDKYSFARDAHLQRRRAEVYEIDDPRREIPPPLPRDRAPEGAVPAAPAAAPAPAPAR